MEQRAEDVNEMNKDDVVEALRTLRFLWTKEKATTTTFILPEEALLMIFRHLDTAEDLCAVSAVCKVFNLVSADDILWRPICSPSWKIPPGECKTHYMKWLRDAIKAYTSKFAEPDESRGIFKSEHGYRIKLIVTGDSALAGKSSFIRRIAEDKFEELPYFRSMPEFVTKRLEIDGQPIELQLWDYPGDRYDYGRRARFYPGTAGAFILFNMTNTTSLEIITVWCKKLDEHLQPNCPRILIGTHMDLLDERVTDCSEKAQAVADEKGMEYLETSAKTGENVAEACLRLTQAALRPGPFGEGGKIPKPLYIPSESTLNRLGIHRGGSPTEEQTENVDSSSWCTLQ